MQALLKSYENLAKKRDVEFSVLAGKLEALNEKERNLKINQPSSKKPKWDKDGKLVRGLEKNQKKKKRKKDHCF